MTQPQVIVGSWESGVHNADLESASKRVKAGKGYRDLSTVCVIPTRGVIPARAVESWWGMISPMNQAFTRIFVSGMEVGDAYNYAIELILNHPVLSKWKYVLTLEEDNLPPPDGLIKLYENIDKYPAGLGGLYWTKGECGQPMIYGDPVGVMNFRPQVPQKDTIQECNGLGMGFTLFSLDVFRDERIEKPWFKTINEWTPEGGAQLGTQDLHFFAKARQAGYKVACDTRVKVGHLDVNTGMVW